MIFDMSLAVHSAQCHCSFHFRRCADSNELPSLEVGRASARRLLLPSLLHSNTPLEPSIDAPARELAICSIDADLLHRSSAEQCASRQD